jgi:hypothetical protein
MTKELQANNKFKLSPDVQIVIFKQEVSIQISGIRFSVSRRILDRAMAIYKAFKEVEQLAS